MDTRDVNDIMSQVTTSHHYLLAQVIIGLIYLWWFYSMVLSAWWAPCMLTDVQKADRTETSLLILFNENPDNFISRFVTVDEIWLHHFDPESKAQSMAWKYVTSPPPSVFASAQSHGHRILGFWRNCTVWLSGTWQNYYRNLLRWSDWKMSSGTEREESRKIATRCVVSSGQCTAHASSQALTAIRNAGFELLCHQSCSPDLAPSDFYLFPELKKFMKGQ